MFGFIDDDLAFGFDALHHALHGGLVEVIGVGFHGPVVNSDVQPIAFVFSSELIIIVKLNSFNY